MNDIAEAQTTISEPFKLGTRELPIACVRYWNDACQDQHYEPALGYVPVRKKRLTLLIKLLREARNTRAADIVPDGWANRVDAALKEYPHG